LYPESGSDKIITDVILWRNVRYQRYYVIFVYQNDVIILIIRNLSPDLESYSNYRDFTLMYNKCNKF